MKKLLSVFILAAMLLCVSCGQSAPTWQEQYDLGVRYLSEGNYEEAIIAFNAAIEIDPKRAEAYIGLADVYTEQGDTEKAAEILAAGLAATGDSALQERLDALTQSAADGAMRAEGDEETLLSNVLELYTADNMDSLRELLRGDEYQALSADLEEGEYLLLGDGDTVAAAYPDYYFYFGQWENGQRSGQGLWIRAYYDGESSTDSYWYLGEWANDLPNGSGTVRKLSDPTKIDRQPNHTYTVDATHIGTFRDGLYHGTFNQTWVMEDGLTRIWEPFSVVDGVPQPRTDIPAGIMNSEYYRSSVAGGSYIIAFDQNGADLWDDGGVRKVLGLSI